MMRTDFTHREQRIALAAFVGGAAYNEWRWHDMPWWIAMLAWLGGTIISLLTFAAINGAKRHGHRWALRLRGKA